MKKGTVYWFVGREGAGKTTLGKIFFEELKKRDLNTVFLDGDELRAVFGGVAGHTLEERAQFAQRYSNLSKMLADQGFNVVCATVAMRREHRKWNENIENYKEIYVKVPTEVLFERDYKELYSKAKRGEIKDLMGVHIEIEEPENPTLVIENDGTKTLDEIKEVLKTKLLES